VGAFSPEDLELVRRGGSGGGGAGRRGRRRRPQRPGLPLGATASLGLWVEALDSYLKGLPTEEVKAPGGAHLEDLTALLPAVAGATGSRPVAEPPRVRLLDGLAQLLAGLSADGPVIIVIDDVHLADGSSWEALGYLARNLAGARILLVLAARPAELHDHAVASQTLLSLEQEGYLRRLPVGPLAEHDVAELARALTGRDERVTGDWSAGVAHGPAWPAKLAAARWQVAAGTGRIVAAALDLWAGGQGAESGELRRLHAHLCDAGLAVDDTLFDDVIGRWAVGEVGSLRG